MVVATETKIKENSILQGKYSWEEIQKLPEDIIQDLAKNIKVYDVKNETEEAILIRQAEIEIENGCKMLNFEDFATKVLAYKPQF